MLINREVPQKETRQKDKAKMLRVVGTVVVAGAILVGGMWFWRTKNSDMKSGEETARITCAEEQTLVGEECQENRVEFLDLSEVVRNWGESRQELTSAYVYDLDNERVAGEFYAESNYETGSLYKLFVVYEGYRRISTGVWADDLEYLVTEAGTLSRTDCLDLAIRESYSTCAEKLWGEIGKAELDEIVRSEFGLMGTTASELVSNPADMAKMMTLYYRHEGINEELVGRMMDSFLNQPATNREGLCEGLCEWRQGVPAGFSEKVKVYNKVGWQGTETSWVFYNDAAIVEIPDEKSGEMRHYVVVVMTKGETPEANRALGWAIEEAV